MNKTAIKNFAIWARNKLIADISYKAGLLGITEKGIKSPLPQSTQTVQFFDIGTKEPNSITGIEIQQRKKLIEEIERKAKQIDYATAYKNVIEEVAYTWFNRLIAIRFMEVNDYLPTRIRVLSSESNGKAEPDLVTHALEANLDYSAYEKDRIIQLKHENKLDELFRMLFIKQCNALNTNLPELFEKTNDYTELLFNISFTDKDGLVYHLVNDISEDDFNVSKEGQVEIIGWLYQYYNTEPKDETFALLKKNVKITKERIPAATQLFTPDWIVRYMVENSLGRLWLEGHPNDELKSNWKYYLDEVEQEEDVQSQLSKIREEYKTIKPKDIKVIDPAMGSGHILVYAFDVLMQIYENYGYSQRDAAKSIVEKNLYGLDIDKRAYQLAYFSVMMKARQYNRRILNENITSHVYAIQESNDINRNHLKFFGADMSAIEKNTALLQIQGLLDYFKDTEEYGSIITVENYNWDLLRRFINDVNIYGQLSLDSLGFEGVRDLLKLLINLGETIACRYDVVITNPPYMGSSGMGTKISDYVKNYYPDSKSDLFAVFIEKCGDMLKPSGYQAMITQHAWMFLSSYEKLRCKLYQGDIVNMVHLGARAFEEISGEVVQTTAFVLTKRSIDNFKSTFVRLVDYTNQQAKEEAFLLGKNIHTETKESFEMIPGSPVAYFWNDKIFACFQKREFFPGNPMKGIQTGNSDKYIRFWFEVSLVKTGLNIYSHKDMIESNKKWFPLTSGGTFRRWFGNIDSVVNLENNGFDIRSTRLTNFRLKDPQYYFQEGLTWTEVTTKPFTCRYLSSNILFGNGGPVGFFLKDKLYYCIGLLNSVVARTFFSVIAPTMNYGPDQVRNIPLVIDNKNRVDDLVKLNIIESKVDWDSFETSLDFKNHPLISEGHTIEAAFDQWDNMTKKRFNTIKANEEELNRIFIGVYGLQDELIPEVEDTEVTVSRADLGRDIRSLISYAVGCMFGRYSLDADGIAYAGGDLDANKYRSFIPARDNIIPICDDDYFDNDIVYRLVEFIKACYGAHKLEENLKFIANALEGKGSGSREIIRNYFLKDFYKDHSKIYQKRPIYWLFDSGKQNGFKALVYMHRYNENTIGDLRIDYLHRMQRIYENEVARMQDTIENSIDAREVTLATKRKEKLIKQLQETKEYDEKIAHLALARTAIDLDDGVKVNYEKVQTDRDGKKFDVLAKI